MFFTDWSQRTLASAATLSRTMAGKDDPTWSHDKPSLAVAEGRVLAGIAEANMRAAIHRVWTARSETFLDAERVRHFLDDLARMVNRGLAKDETQLFRTWKTKYAGPVAPEQIEQAHTALCGWLFGALRDETDLVPVAAELERGIALLVHPYADACGRVARLSGAGVLLREHRFPARFENREAYYDAMQRPDWISRYRAAL